jgi:hypothetical protein
LIEQLTRKDRDRFETFFWRTAPEECWTWTGGRDKDGYGLFSTKDSSYRSHRLSWFLEFGKFDQSLMVLHNCDNPICVNPYHLFLGTHQDNVDDKVKKRRQSRPSGEINGRAKISDLQVEELRELYKSQKYTQKELGRIFNLSKSQISLLVNYGRKTNKLY